MVAKLGVGINSWKGVLATSAGMALVTFLKFISGMLSSESSESWVAASAGQFWSQVLLGRFSSSDSEDEV